MSIADDKPSRKTIGFSGGFGSSPAAPMIMKVWPLNAKSSDCHPAISNWTYWLWSYFFPWWIILKAMVIRRFPSALSRERHLQDTTLDHDLHTFYWDSSHLINNTFEHSRGEIGVKLNIMRLSSMFDVHRDGGHDCGWASPVQLSQSGLNDASRLRHTLPSHVMRRTYFFLTYNR